MGLGHIADSIPYLNKDVGQQLLLSNYQSFISALFNFINLWDFFDGKSVTNYFKYLN